jgi:hypothetical protein
MTGNQRQKREIYVKREQKIFAKLKDKLLTTGISALVVPSVIAALFFFEGSLLKENQLIKQAIKEVQSISATQLNPDHQGDLIHVKGTLELSNSLKDPILLENLNAISFIREVKMFQWKEVKETEAQESEEIEKYSYDKVWDSEYHDSREFAVALQDHVNPASPVVQSTTTRVNQVKLGAFILSDTLVSSLLLYKEFEFDTSSTSIVKPGNPLGIDLYPNQFTIGNTLFFGKGTADNPEIGDLKVNYKVSRPANIYTVIGTQSGDSLIAFTNKKNKSKLILTSDNEMEAQQLLEEGKAGNTMIISTARGGTFVILYFVFLTLFKPLRGLISYTTVIGTLLHKGLSFFARMMAFIITSATTAIAWIFYQPLIGFTILLISITIFYFFWKRNKKEINTDTTST